MSLSDAPDVDETRVSTGVPGFDFVLGGGFVPPCVVLIGGSRGCGKSSMLLPMCAHSPERNSLYITTEQRVEDLKRSAKRFGLQKEIPRINVLASREVGTILQILERRNPRIVVVDSLNKLIDSEYDTTDKMKNLIDNQWELIQDARENNRCLVLVSHLNKEGKLSGAEELQHDVDVVVEMNRLTKVYRRLDVTKSRIGSEEPVAYFEMATTGLILLPGDPTAPDDADGDDSAPPKRRTRRHF